MSQTANQRPSRLHLRPAASEVVNSTRLRSLYVPGAKRSRISAPATRHSRAKTPPLLLPAPASVSSEGRYPHPLPSLPRNLGSRISTALPVFRHHILTDAVKSLQTSTSSSLAPNSACTFLPMPPEPLLMMAFHLSSRRSYTRVVS